MGFLVESLTSDPSVFKKRMEAYYEYLESVRDRLPADAFHLRRRPGTTISVIMTA